MKYEANKIVSVVGETVTAHASIKEAHQHLHAVYQQTGILGYAAEQTPWGMLKPIIWSATL